MARTTSWRYVLDFIRRRKSSYQLTFKTPNGEEVLSDLAKFCRANQTCFHPDPRINASLEGRREVWLRIAEHLNLTPNQLYQLYNPARPGQVYQQPEGDE